MINLLSTLSAPNKSGVNQRLASYKIKINIKRIQRAANKKR